jgi:hypothetical protein
MFALKNIATGKLMGVYGSSNSEGEFCVGVEYILSESMDNVWVVYDRDTAEFAAKNDAPWYNSSYETPSNSYVGRLEVVELFVRGD